MNARYINLLEKRQLYEKARLQLQEWYGAEQADLGSCLYWGQVTMKILTQAGLRPVLQAGTMQWRMVPPALDDGISPTHFSYVWTPGSPESRADVAAGHLPEMHVWVGLPDSSELVDFSTGTFRKLAQERFGLRWLGPDPPAFIWGIHLTGPSTSRIERLSSSRSRPLLGVPATESTVV